MDDAALIAPLRSANIAPTSGAEALVPPKIIQPEDDRVTGPQTTTPVFGCATAEMSPSMRPPQASVTPFCQVGLGWPRPQPLPAPSQTVSVKPRVPPPTTRWVPPTAMAPGALAGHCAP